MTDATDLAELARHARRALADPHQATLMVNGAGHHTAHDPDVMLHDRGQPTFVCWPDSPITASARLGLAARLVVSTLAADAAVFTTTFAGRLALVGVEQVDEVSVDVVGLSLESLLVECHDPGGTRVARYEVPLELYAHAESEEVAAYAREVATHINADHQNELRTFVMMRYGLPFQAIAGVSLAALDSCGVDIHWVDTTGGRTTTIAFAEPALTPSQLADRLGASLGRACSS